MPYGKIATAAAAYEIGTQVYEKGKAWWTNRVTYTVSISETQPFYPDVHDWLVESTPGEKQRQLSLSQRGYDSSNMMVSESPESGPDTKPKVRVSFNDTRSKTVAVEGHRVKVHVSDSAQPAGNQNDPGKYRFEPRIIEFQCRTYEAQQAVIRLVQKLMDTKSERKPRLRLVSQWGSWVSRNDLPDRSLDSVVIDSAQKKRIVDDLQYFLESEKRYVDLAVPYHRGYMFHGPPGGGKTSLAKALASYFALDIWYVSLSDLKEETSLLSLLSEVSPRSMVLLEDIDTLRISQERDSTEPGTISTSSLLNALDGVATPHGLITVMTTNHFEKLDEALTRKGRMDVVEEIHPPTIREVEALYHRFYGRPFEWTWMKSKLPSGPLPLSQATVSEIFKKHLDDPFAASVELSQKLEAIAYEH